MEAEIKLTQLVLGNSATHCEMLKIINEHRITSYLATAMEQDGALGHGSVKTLLSEQLLVQGIPVKSVFNFAHWLLGRCFSL